MTIDEATLADLIEFSRLEQEANDIEPWAEVIRNLPLPSEDRLWVTKLYNATDDLASSWSIYQRWQSPFEYQAARPEERDYVNTLPVSQERRNMRGRKLSRHLDDYVTHLAGRDQDIWLNRNIDPNWRFRFDNCDVLMEQLREIWGVGRQTAFEWAEFAAKVGNLPVETRDGALWESSGPRQSVERICNLGEGVTPSELNLAANQMKAAFEKAGVYLTWWDFETVICDFNVMRKGRYYVGQHLAMIKGEIESTGDDLLMAVYHSVIPSPWRDLPSGVDKSLRQAYRNLGVLWNPVQGAKIEN